MHKTVGIVGGMGPAATCLLYKYIIDNTCAANDKEHIHVIIDNNNDIPDRTQAIINGNREPVDYICRSAHRLINAGAELLAMPCNTAHYFYNEIQAQIKVPFINMIEETAIYCKEDLLSKVGVLATDGTVFSDVYGQELRKHGIDAIYPSKGQQKKVMESIYDYVKAGRKVHEGFLSDCVLELKDKGCVGIILGCTELPIVFRKEILTDRYIDSLNVLAKRIVVAAGYHLNVFS